MYTHVVWCGACSLYLLSSLQSPSIFWNLLESGSSKCNNSFVHWLTWLLCDVRPIIVYVLCTIWQKHCRYRTESNSTYNMFVFSFFFLFGFCFFFSQIQNALQLLRATFQSIYVGICICKKWFSMILENESSW